MQVEKDFLCSNFTKCQFQTRVITIKELKMNLWRLNLARENTAICSAQRNNTMKKWYKTNIDQHDLSFMIQNDAAMFSPFSITISLSHLVVDIPHTLSFSQTLLSQSPNLTNYTSCTCWINVMLSPFSNILPEMTEMSRIKIFITLIIRPIKYHILHILHICRDADTALKNHPRMQHHN